MCYIFYSNLMSILVWNNQCATNGLSMLRLKTRCYEEPQLKRHPPLLHAELCCSRPAPSRWRSSGCRPARSLSSAAAGARSLTFSLLQRQRSRPAHGKANLWAEDFLKSSFKRSKRLKLKMSDGRAHQRLWWHPALSSCTGSRRNLCTQTQSFNWPALPVCASVCVRPLTSVRVRVLQSVIVWREQTRLKVDFLDVAQFGLDLLPELLQSTRWTQQKCDITVRLFATVLFWRTSV